MNQQTSGFGAFAKPAATPPSEPPSEPTVTESAVVDFEPRTYTCLPVQHFGLGEHYVFVDGYLVVTSAEADAGFRELLATQPVQVQNMIKQVAQRESLVPVAFARGADNSVNGAPAAPTPS